jgi:hypothetical protein
MAELDLDTSFRKLQSFQDLDDLDAVEGCQERWIAEAKKKLNCEEEDNLSAELFNKHLTKAVLTHWIADARDIMCRQREVMQDMKDIIGALKTEALGDKGRVIKLQDGLIKLQDQLLERKEEQLQSLQSAVQTTVQDAVQTEIRSYGEVLKAPSAPAISTATFRKVVKDAIEDEDRSKNLVVFGLSEEDGEQLDEKLSDVFMDLGEKPRVEAVRIGRRPEASGSNCRPVKVTLGSSTAVQQILSKAKALKQMDKWKAVYVSPDRSPAERSARRLLVEERKKRATEQPERNHFIKGGKVCSEDKT